MSTEQKDLEQNALASRLSRGWEKFKQGKLISYPMMAVLLVVVTGIGLYFWISSERKKAASALWTEMESLTTVTALEEFAERNADKPVARVARLHAARTLAGPEGIELLAARVPESRKRAVENVVKAQGMFEKLADEFKDDPVLRVECLLGAAKGEEALIGVSKEGKSGEFYGGIDKLIERLQRLAEAAPGTPWGEDAKKRAETLRNDRAARDELTRIQVALYTLPTGPTLPPLGPTAPGGLSPGPVPGLPGATPVPPTPTPPAPISPGATPPAGTTPTPKTPPPAPGLVPPAVTPPAETPPGTPPMSPGSTPPDPKGGTTPTPPAPPPPKPPEKK
jgi:hypothetical protein